MAGANRVVPNNYYATSCEVKLYYKLFQDSKFLIKPAIGEYGTNINQTLWGCTNFSFRFIVNNGNFRGIGDCTQVRKPVSWEASAEFTRYITSVDDFVFNSSTLGSVSSNNVYMQNNNVIGLKLAVPNVAGTKNLIIFGAFAIENVSLSAEKENVSESVRASSYNRWGIESAIV